MFGIGLPEMILIMALALIVVGPDKLPDLARSLAKGLMELKKTAEGLKDSFTEEGNPFDEIRPDLEKAAKNFKANLLDVPPYKRDEAESFTGVNPPADSSAKNNVTEDAYQDLMQHTTKTTAPQTSSPPGADDLKPLNAETSPAGTTKSDPTSTAKPKESE